MIRSQIIPDHLFWRSSCLDLTLSQIIENCTLYCILIHQSFQIDLFRIKITNTNEIVLNSEFLDATLFNEMQAQSARCRIIRFMSNRDYLGYKTNYQWDKLINRAKLGRQLVTVWMINSDWPNPRANPRGCLQKSFDFKVFKIVLILYYF